MKGLHRFSAIAAAGLLAACSQSPDVTAEAGAAADQACLNAVAQKTGAADAQVERSQTDYGASLVVVRAGGSLWRCKFSGGILKDISSVAG
jgi:hypothetical protein